MTGLGILPMSGLAQVNQTEQSNRIHIIHVIHINTPAIRNHYTNAFPHHINMEHSSLLFPYPLAIKVADTAVLEAFLYKSVYISV